MIASCSCKFLFLISATNADKPNEYKNKNDIRGICNLKERWLFHYNLYFLFICLYKLSVIIFIWINNNTQNIILHRNITRVIIHIICYTNETKMIKKRTQHATILLQMLGWQNLHNCENIQTGYIPLTL